MSPVDPSRKLSGNGVPAGAADDFEKLRRLLLEPEQDRLQALQDRLEDKERRAREVSGILPQAAALSAEHGEELSRALRPVIGNAIRDSIEKQPQGFIDAFHPIIGALVRRSIAESFRTLMQSLNQALENTFSWQGLKWRIEAWRTGRSFAEVVLLRSLVYRVEQIFLIHRETSLLLLQVEAETASVHDPDMVASMLSAIQDFSRDSFKSDGGAALEEFRVGELEVWIESESKASLAAVIRGNPPRELRTVLGEAIETVHTLKGPALADFKGDTSAFESLRPELEACLRAQYRQGEAAGKSLTKAWVALGAVIALLAAGISFIVAGERRWDDFLHRLRAEPGIAITQAHKGWFRASEVAGLRDPLSADPASLARQAGIDPARIHFDWKGYLALDATSVLRRVGQRFGAPTGTELAIEPEGILVISGQAPYEWLERVRREYARVAGVNSVLEQGLKVAYDPTLALQRFENAYPLPAGVAAHVEEGTLRLSGKAPPDWIARVREGATHLPGIDTLADRELQTAFDPALVLREFKDRFGMPDGVNATVRDGVLAISGEAPHTWLLRVRAESASIPGVTSLDESHATDLDNTAFQQLKTAIEKTSVYFPSGRDDFGTESFATLSQLPDEIRRFQAAARRLDIGMTIEIVGSADAPGTEATNMNISSRRADAVRDFLLSCGLAPELFKVSVAPLVHPSPNPAGAAPNDTDRHVTFHVVQQP